MKKTIKRAIEVTTRSRKCDRLKAEFYSHDKNNATIELTLDEVTAEQVIALFYFTASKRYYQTTAAIEENKIKIEFDTSLITQDESVICFIYFEKVEQSADVYRFAFDVKMSEIDKTREIPIEEKVSRRVVDISDIVTKKEMDALFERLNITGGYDDRPLIERLERLESKPSETYDDSALKQRVEALEAKTDKDTVYDDTDVKERISALEGKPEVDISGLVTKDELASKNYLTSHQDLSEYARKSELPQKYDDEELKRRVSDLEKRPDKDIIYDDSSLKQRLTTLESSALTRKDLQPEVLTHQLDELRTQVAQAPKGKLGQNLLANSGNKVTNKQYPTTYLSFVQQPTAGTQYTLTVKVDAPASKTGVVVQVRGNVSFGALNKVGDGIYSSTFTWNPRPQDKPFELVVYQPPNNNVEASLVWAKFVEGVDTDYTWYPNYNEVSNVYTFAEEASTAIESSANLLEGTLAEKTSATEFMSYADIASVIDAYGTGKYTLSFDLKAKTAGTMGVYMSGTTKYTFLQEVVPVTTEYQRITMHLDISTNTPTATAATLSFFGGKYGNGVIPSVRKLRLSKGIYKELPWKPSNKELSSVYETLMTPKGESTIVW